MLDQLRAVHGRQRHESTTPPTADCPTKKLRGEEPRTSHARGEEPRASHALPAKKRRLGGLPAGVAD